MDALRHPEPWKSFLSGVAGGVVAMGTAAIGPPDFVYGFLWGLFIAPLALTLAGVGCGVVGVSWEETEAALVGFAGVALGLVVPLAIMAWPPGSVDAVLVAVFIVAMAAVPYLVGFTLAVRDAERESGAAREKTPERESGADREKTPEPGAPRLPPGHH